MPSNRNQQSAQVKQQPAQQQSQQSQVAQQQQQQQQQQQVSMYEQDMKNEDLHAFEDGSATSDSGSTSDGDISSSVNGSPVGQKQRSETYEPNLLVYTLIRASTLAPFTRVLDRLFYLGYNGVFAPPISQFKLTLAKRKVAPLVTVCMISHRVRRICCIAENDSIH